MGSGIYVHIPYCLQRCPYCDFATFKFDETIPMAQYLLLLAKELECRSALVPFRQLDSIYFGGGTPSLLAPHDIEWLIKQIFKQGFYFSKGAEVTIEINPGTISGQKISDLRRAGVNRFSVGCQTMSDRLLKIIGRKHSSADTRETLYQLEKSNANFSVDVLFALPTQTRQELQADLNELLQYSPKHVSPYYLTLPSNHLLQKNRPTEDVEIEMFELVGNTLLKSGFHQYEISNFAIPRFESHHNMLYWDDSSYWGVGLSAHSYFNAPNWGFRFWNPKTMEKYREQIELRNFSELPFSQRENLEKHESLTDFCHTSLRISEGLSKGALQRKFGERALEAVSVRMAGPIADLFVQDTNSHWKLTASGSLLSNQVFSQILFTSSCLI